MYNKIKGVFGKVQNLLLVLIGIALAVMMSVIMLQTLTRYVIFYSLPWSEELSRYLFVFVIMIGLTVAIKDDMLISIDLIDRFLPKKADKVLDAFRKLLALAVSIIIVICCSRMFTIGRIQKSPAMGIPMITMYGTIFVSYILATVSLVFKIIDDFREALGITEEGEEK
ncbi:TRAP transporter small permease [Clostridium sp. AM58-1XD]|uniref:TRAP transporter small permease n=1 Tax=Clostridium sp. AM58-1XD TaxID=2292307 RepID=UPI000E4DED98|nr:TRAP transporter small permease [Clostridium sp. AM58-1XD]RGY97838.1 TRAP transporter small permease [Clostridium sp. AM58-1XD]